MCNVQRTKRTKLSVIDRIFSFQPPFSRFCERTKRTKRTMKNCNVQNVQNVQSAKTPAAIKGQTRNPPVFATYKTYKTYNGDCSCPARFRAVFFQNVQSVQRQPRRRITYRIRTYPVFTLRRVTFQPFSRRFSCCQNGISSSFSATVYPAGTSVRVSSVSALSSSGPLCSASSASS